MAKQGSKWKKNQDSTPRIDPLEKIADRFVAALSEGKMPWRQTFRRDQTPFFNAVSNRPYQGVNQLLLAMSDAADSGDPRWMTFKQAKEKGYNIKKGEHGTAIVFFKEIQAKSRDPEPSAETQSKFDVDESAKEAGDIPEQEASTRKVMVAKEYYVFNGSQIEGIEPWVNPVIQNTDVSPNELAQDVIDESGAVIKFGQPKYPCYSPLEDVIKMYPAGQFESMDHYYSVILHELTHWTGHSSRTGRLDKLDYQNNQADRAKEELTAEIGSYMLMGALGISGDEGHPDTQHTAYVQAWIEHIQSDKRRAIWQAVKRANMAMEFIAGLSPTLQSQLELARAIPAAKVENEAGTPEAGSVDPWPKDIDTYVTVAADSIAALREMDVFRLLESNSEDIRPALARYIAHTRPEFEKEVDEVMREEFHLPEWRTAGMAVAPEPEATSEEATDDITDGEAPSKTFAPPKKKRQARPDEGMVPEDFMDPPEAADAPSAPSTSEAIQTFINVSGVKLGAGDWLRLGHDIVVEYGLEHAISANSLITPEVSFPDGEHWDGTVLLSPDDVGAVQRILGERGVALNPVGLVEGGERQLEILRKLPSYDAGFIGRVVEEGARFNVCGVPSEVAGATVTRLTREACTLAKDSGGGFTKPTIELFEYVMPDAVVEPPEPEPAAPAVVAQKPETKAVFDFG